MFVGNINSNMGPKGVEVAAAAEVEDLAQLSVAKAVRLFFCDASGCQNSSEKMLRCSRCREVHYCSLQCQHTAWAIHKQICIKPGQDQFQGTTGDLLKLLKSPPGPDEEVCSYMTQDGRVVQLTQREFGEKTGKIFVNYFVAEKISVIAEFRLKYSNNLPRIDGVDTLSSNSQLMKKFLDIPPKLCLMDQKGMGLCLMACQKIQRGDFITFYYGKIIPDSEWHSPHYSFERVDSHHFINYGAYANDGVPNAILFHVANFRGLPLAPLVRAQKEINEGEFIQLDYGCKHSIKRLNYKISKSDIEFIKSFFSNPQLLKNALMECEKVIPTLKSLNDLPPYSLMLLLYVFSTPAVFTRLLLEGDGIFYSAYRKIRKSEIIMNFFQEQEKENAFFDITYPIVAGFIGKLKKESREIYALRNLSKQMTAGSFMTTLGIMNQDEEFSVKQLPKYEIFGKILDVLDIFLAWSGACDGFDEKSEKEALEVKELPPCLIDMFKDLSLNLKKIVVYQLIDLYIERAKATNRHNKIEGFLKLKWELERIFIDCYNLE